MKGGLWELTWLQSQTQPLPVSHLVLKCQDGDNKQRHLEAWKHGYILVATIHLLYCFWSLFTKSCALYDDLSRDAKIISAEICVA